MIAEVTHVASALFRADMQRGVAEAGQDTRAATSHRFYVAPEAAVEKERAAAPNTAADPESGLRSDRRSYGDDAARALADRRGEMLYMFGDPKAAVDELTYERLKALTDLPPQLSRVVEAEAQALTARIRLARHTASASSEETRHAARAQHFEHEKVAQAYAQVDLTEVARQVSLDAVG